jgi:electron transport complex protein RnfG
MNRISAASIMSIACLITTLALALEGQRDALKAVSPDADNFIEKTVDGIDYFEAMKDNRLVGYCIKTSSSGYRGAIDMMVGIDLNGTIKGINILNHKETPGIGSKINEIKPGDREPYFLKQFTGKDARQIEIGKDIDAVTGATISSMAVTDGIRDTVERFLSKVKRQD